MKTSIGRLGLLCLLAATSARAQTASTGVKKAAAPSVQEVVVTATRPASQTLIDRKVYTVTQDLQATTGSAADVLDNVPSVSVDADGNVSLRGESNVTVLVDGKPSAQFAGATRGLSLQQFPASDIDRIEVLTNPPAQYKAEGTGGVINIVTRKTHKLGPTGGAQLSLGDQRRYVFAANAAHESPQLKLNAAIGLRQEAKQRITTDQRTTIDPSSLLATQSTQTTDERFRRLIPSVKASADWTLGERQVVGAAFSHRELTGVRYFNQDDAGGPPALSPTSRSDRHSDGHEWSVDESKGLTFEQKLSRPGETLNFGVQQSVTRERERYAYKNTFTLPTSPATFDDLHLSLDLEKTELSADYDLPMTNMRELRLGYDFEQDRNAFDNTGDTRDPSTGQVIPNPAVSNHFRYRQQVSAAYGDYQAPLGLWRVEAGLRLETADISTYQITGGIAGGHREFAAFPNLHLSREVGDEGKLAASVTRRINRPDPEALNPFADHQDTHNLRAGNPDLRPQETWSYELGYSGGAGALGYGATVYARFDRNSVTDVVRPVAPDIVLATKANLPRSRSVGLEFNANSKLGPSLSYGLSGNLFNTQIDAVSLGAPGLKSTTGLNLKAHVDYRPTSADTAQLSLSRTDRRLTPQGEIRALTLVNLGYRHQVRADLAVVATLSDALDGQRTQRLISTAALRDVYLRRQVGRIAAVGLVYTFGGSKKTKSLGFDYDS